MAKRKHQLNLKESADTGQTDSKRSMPADLSDIDACVDRIHSLHTIELKESALMLAEKAVIHLEFARYIKAIKWADRSLAIDESNFKARYCKAMALVKLDLSAEAMPYLESCVEMSQNNVKVCQLFEEVSKHVYENSINQLNDDALLEIFHLLPFKDRMVVELVSKRFNRLGKTHGWSNFYEMSMFYSYPSAHIKKKITGYSEKVVPLFERCGRFLREINMNNFDVTKTVFAKHLSKFPNLQHLIMNERENAAGIKLIEDTMSLKLTSLEMDILGYVDQWNELLKNCSKLELLKVYMGISMNSITIPKTLKYLHVYGRTLSSQLCRSIFEQAEQLTSLVLDVLYWNIDFTNSFKLDGLKYLAVYLGDGTSSRNDQKLRSLFKNCPSVKAVDLITAFEIFSIESIGGDQLEHLGITFYSISKAEYFAGYADNLRFLSSLSVLGLGIVNSELIKFFQKLAMQGNLMYFETSTDMPTEIICEALQLCTNLKYVSWKYDENTDWNLLMQTLDEIHGDMKPTEEGDYDHILRLFGFAPSDVPPIEHPWLKFCNGRVVSPICERYRVGCLSSKSKFIG